MKQKNKIEYDKEYSLKEVVDQRLIPWALHYQTLKRIIKKGEIEARVCGDGKGKRYTVHGYALINYINKRVEKLTVPIY